MHKLCLVLCLLLLSLTTVATAASSASSEAWQWYHRADTQCVVNHEGNWTTWSRSPYGMYRGRFQMDWNFEHSTRLGTWASERYGRADRWPAEIQVQHAYQVWQRRWWNPWPTYFAYCA